MNWLDLCTSIFQLFHDVLKKFNIARTCLIWQTVQYTFLLISMYLPSKRTDWRTNQSL